MLFYQRRCLSYVMEEKQRTDTSKYVKNPLLTVAGGGFPLDSFSGSALLVPVSENCPSVLPDDVVGEDRFLGQDSAPPPPVQSATAYDVNLRGPAEDPPGNQPPEEQALRSDPAASALAGLSSSFTALTASLPSAFSFFSAAAHEPPPAEATPPPPVYQPPLLPPPPEDDQDNAPGLETVPLDTSSSSPPPVFFNPATFQQKSAAATTSATRSVAHPSASVYAQTVALPPPSDGPAPSAPPATTHWGIQPIVSEPPPLRPLSTSASFPPALQSIGSFFTGSSNQQPPQAPWHPLGQSPSPALSAPASTPPLSRDNYRNSPTPRGPPPAGPPPTGPHAAPPAGGAKSYSLGGHRRPTYAPVPGLLLSSAAQPMAPGVTPGLATLPPSGHYENTPPHGSQSIVSSQSYDTFFSGPVGDPSIFGPPPSRTPPTFGFPPRTGGSPSLSTAPSLYGVPPSVTSSSLIAPPPTSIAQPPSSIAQPPSSIAQPPSSIAQPPSSIAQPPSSIAQPPSSIAQPPSSFAPPPSSIAPPPSSIAPPPSSIAQPPTPIAPPQSSIAPPQSTVAPPPSSIAQPPSSVSPLQSFFSPSLFTPSQSSFDTVISAFTQSASTAGPPPSSIAPQFSSNAPQLFSNAPPTFSNASPTFSNAPPTFSNAPPTFSNAPPTFSNASPTFSNAPPPSSNAPPPSSNAPPPSSIAPPPSSIAPPPSSIAPPPSSIAPPPSSIAPPPSSIAPPPSSIAPPPSSIAPPPSSIASSSQPIGPPPSSIVFNPSPIAPPPSSTATPPAFTAPPSTFAPTLSSAAQPPTSSAASYFAASEPLEAPQPFTQSPWSSNQTSSPSFGQPPLPVDTSNFFDGPPSNASWSTTSQNNPPTSMSFKESAADVTPDGVAPSKVDPQTDVPPTEGGSTWSLDPTQLSGTPRNLNPDREIVAEMAPGQNGSAVLDCTQYKPVYYHWFYKKETPRKVVWQPFSMKDSLALEAAFKSQNLSSETVVATDGGRYDVHLVARTRTAVYWDEGVGQVRRCSWFYKGDNSLVPYEESVADRLEEEYKTAMTNGEWQKRVKFSEDEMIIFYSPHALYHCMSSSSSDSWGNVPQSPTRSRAVKRGLEGFVIPEGEPDTVDHLLFLVQGIGSACDFKFRGIVEVVDDFRTLALQLMDSHFSEAVRSDKAHRIEVLPIAWHEKLHGDETGIDQRLGNITLPTVPKLRDLANDCIADVLFYTSPVYCQTIVGTVGSELNRLYDLFLKRNPNFKGEVSVSGHSLGSLILFDLLCHQKSPMSKQSKSHVTRKSPESAAKLLTEEDDAFSDDQSEENHPPSSSKKKTLTRRTSYVMFGPLGAGQPYITYPQLHFHPRNFFAYGSPIGIFVTVRGIELLGEDFAFPTCPSFFNIFHPCDLVAYRIEALIKPDMVNVRPVLIPHHKGRKRMHLELKETMARMGADIKQRVLDSVYNTWNTVCQLSMFHKNDEQLRHDMNQAIEEEMWELGKNNNGSKASTQKDADPNIKVGKLNGGRRVDYVLQETPLESFNEYISAIYSHVCYWTSEDTTLMTLKEIYASAGIPADRQLPQEHVILGSAKGSPSPPPVDSISLAPNSSKSAS